MRILLTVDCVGGVWTYGLELVRELAAAHHEVIVAALGGELSDDQRSALDASGVVAWYSRPYRLEWMPDAGTDLDRAGDWLLALARHHRPDVVHLNQYGHARLPWDRPVLVGAHSDVVTWWRAVHGTDPGPEWTGYRQRVAEGLAAADLVVAPTQNYLDELREAYDVQTPHEVVHNGRRAHPAPAGSGPQLLAAGRVWDPAKNVATAVRAAEGLCWPLTVAGPGDCADAGGTARFLGRVPADDLAQLFAGAAAFVAPARYEPFGLAALEAGLAGCALVLGDLPTLREVWGPAAIFVDPDDEQGLRARLQTLIDDPDLLQAQQRAASTRAATFTPAAMAAGYLAHYRALLGHTADRVAS